MTDQKIFIAGYYPDEESEKAGIKRVATAFNAKDIERAKAKANFIFLEEYPHAQDAAFKILVCEDTPDVPGRPSRGTWNEEFLYEYDWPEDVGHPVKRQAEKVDFDKLSRELQIAALIKYGSTELTKSDLPGALELTQEDDSFEGHMYVAIIKTPEVANMFHEHIENAIGWLGAKCDHTAKWPEIQKELANWKKRRDGERKATAPSKSIVGIARDKAANATLNQTAVPHEVTERPKRSYKHTYQTLDQELANAFWPGDVNPGNVEGEIYRWAKNEVIAKDRDDWKRFSMSMRTTENALKYDLLTIRDVVQMRPDDIHKNPVSLNEYITGFLLTHGVFEDETEQNQTGTTGPLDDAASTAGAVEPEHNADGSAAGPLETAPQVERTGPFYYLFADGVKVGRANKMPGLEKALADGGKEISQDEYLARKNGTYEAPAAPADNSGAGNEPEVTNHGSGRFSIDGLLAEKPKEDVPKSENSQVEQDDSENETTGAESVQAAINARAENAEGEFKSYTDASAKENMSIWMRVHKTDPSRTKSKIQYGKDKLPDGSKQILRVTTSINPTYQTERATRLFGPFGIGWGVNIEMERFDNGMPFTEPTYDANGRFTGKKVIRDNDGTIIFTLNHTMLISLWYIHNGVKGVISSYGHTKYLYQTQNGITCDDEYAKKSLTDATTKALSQLGFSADVYGGLFEDSEYSEQNKLEHDLINATNRADEVVRIREELDQRFKANVETMKSAKTPNEVSKIASSLTRKIGEHLKAANATGDHDYVKYLDGRLNRLETIKVECLKALEEKA
nr:exodeoxyribonuclease VIII [Enterobacter mori]